MIVVPDIPDHSKPRPSCSTGELLARALDSVRTNRKPVCLWVRRQDAKDVKEYLAQQVDVTYRRVDRKYLTDFWIKLKEQTT